jgi:hypothetical protein
MGKSLGYVAFIVSQVGLLWHLPRSNYVLAAWLFLLSNLVSIVGAAVLETKLHFSSLELIIFILNAGCYLLCSNQSIILWSTLALIAYLSSAYTFYHTVLEPGSIIITKEVYLVNRLPVIVRIAVDILINYYRVMLMRKVGHETTVGECRPGRAERQDHPNPRGP